MEHEAAARLDRPAVVDRAVRRLPRLQPQLLQETAQAKAGPLVADPDADGAVLVMRADGDHRPLEARIGHSRHGQEKLAGQKGRLVHNPVMRKPALRSKPRRQLGRYLVARTCGIYWPR